MNSDERSYGDQSSRYWSQFNSLRVQFSHLTQCKTASPSGISSQNNPSNKISVKPELQRWSTCLGIDVTMLELEESFINLVNNIDQRTFALVKRTREDHVPKSNSSHTAEDIELLKESSERNWIWLENLSKAVQKHVSNASNYHLCHQMLLQYQLSIANIGLLERKTLAKDDFDGNYEEANDIFHALKNHLSEYLTWWQKIELLISHSRTISPIGLRLKPTDIKRPLTMLIEYKQDKITLHKDEKTFLVQNDTRQRWIIENTQKERVDDVPSICCELSPPDIDIIENALLLRLELLANWTSTMKELGCILMSYVAKIIGHWSIVDVSQCKGCDGSRDNVFHSLFVIEALLNKYWDNSPQLMYLQGKINVLRAEIEMRDGDDVVEDSAQINRNTMFIDMSSQVLRKDVENNSKSKSETSILQKRTIDILVHLYKELHKYWDNYREFMDDPSLLSLIENIKTESNNLDEMVARSSDKLMSCLSDNDSTAWSGYLNTLVEKKNTGNYKTSQEHQLLDMLHTSSQPRSQYRSKIEISVPAEKELCFSKKRTSTTPINIKQYFASSLLPKPEKSSVPFVEEMPIDRKVNSSSMSRIHSKKNWDRDLYWQQNRIQTYYMVLNLPRTDRITTVLDRRLNKLLSPSQAREDGLADENFIEILDTDTNIKYHFNAAVTKGLISLTPTVKSVNLSRSNSVSCDNFIKSVFRIDGVLDPNKDDWISLRDAVDRNIVNYRSGQIRLNKTDFCHILKAISMDHVRGRRIYNCNIKSLPPEMTIEIPKLL